MNEIQAMYAMAKLDMVAVKRVYMNTIKAKSLSTNNLLNIGFEEIVPFPTELILPDGREVIVTHGRAFVPTTTLFEKISKEQQLYDSTVVESTSPSIPGESLTSVLCPICTANMAKNSICPNCTKGKQGFKIQCICTECGHEVFL